MELTDKQKQILGVLKEGELPISKIAFLVSSNIYHIEPVLEDLEEKGLIISEKRNNATYWRLLNE